MGTEAEDVKHMTEALLAAKEAAKDRKAGSTTAATVTNSTGTTAKHNRESTAIGVSSSVSGSASGSFDDDSLGFPTPPSDLPPEPASGANPIKGMTKSGSQGSGSTTGLSAGVMAEHGKLHHAEDNHHSAESITSNSTQPAAVSSTNYHDASSRMKEMGTASTDSKGSASASSQVSTSTGASNSRSASESVSISVSSSGSTSRGSGRGEALKEPANHNSTAVPPTGLHSSPSTSAMSHDDHENATSTTFAASAHQDDYGKRGASGNDTTAGTQTDTDYGRPGLSADTETLNTEKNGQQGRPGTSWADGANEGGDRTAEQPDVKEPSSPQHDADNDIRGRHESGSGATHKNGGSGPRSGAPTQAYDALTDSHRNDYKTAKGSMNGKGVGPQLPPVGASTEENFEPDSTGSDGPFPPAGGSDPFGTLSQKQAVSGSPNPPVGPTATGAEKSESAADNSSGDDSDPDILPPTDSGNLPADLNDLVEGLGGGPDSADGPAEDHSPVNNPARSTSGNGKYGPE